MQNAPSVTPRPLHCCSLTSIEPIAHLNSLGLLNVTQQAPGKRTGFAPVLESYLALENYHTIALSPLHAAPIAAGKITRNFHRHHLKPLKIVHHDIGSSPFDQGRRSFSASAAV